MRECLANTRELAERVLRILAEDNDTVLDVETSGLDWRVNHTVGYVLTFRDEMSYYVPLRHAGGGNLTGCSVPKTPTGWKGDLHWFEIELAKLAASRHRKVSGHNLIFDLRFCKRHSIIWYATFEDSMINAPLLDENQFGYSLDVVAKREEVQAKKGDDLYQYMAAQFGGEPTKKIMEHFWRTDASEPIVWEYAAGDGVTTEELLSKQRPQIVEEDEYGFDLVRVHNVECRLIKTLFRMTSGGVRIDEERLHQADKHFERKAQQLGDKFPPGFNSKSPLALKEYLKDQIGEDWPRNAPTSVELKKAYKDSRKAVGALKFDAGTLALVPQGRDIISFRQMGNARSLYTGPMLERHLSNGHVYCQFAQMAQDDYGTISGRLSCYDPNLQAVSKRNKQIGPVYRSVFVADEGCTWEDRDYQQQEYVVFTDYSKDENLMEGYAATPRVDIHSTVATILGVERDPTAKRMNLGLLYGMGLEKLAFSLGVTVAQAKEWSDLYHKKFPTARPFMKGAEARAKVRGYVKTYLGRKRRFPRADFAHKAGNAIVQGSSADITKLKMVEIDEYFASEGDHCRLMLQIHDSLSWSAPKDAKGLKMTAEADRIMADFYSDNAAIKMVAKMGIDTASGDNWAQATWDAETIAKAWS